MSIATDILNGQHDSELDSIVAAIQGRRKALSYVTVAKLGPGDEVQFSANIRPKYLVGKTATVVKVNRESVIVSCPSDPSYGRFNGSRNVRCPNNLIAGLA